MRHIPSGLSVLLFLAALVLSTPGAVSGQEGSTITVTDAVLTSAVEDRQPVDMLSSTVPADVGQVYLWTRITGVQGESAVAHVWYYRDREMARVPVRVMGPSWRTWTSKRMLPEWTGGWRVEVLNNNDQVLQTVSFQVEG